MSKKQTTKVVFRYYSGSNVALAVFPQLPGNNVAERMLFISELSKGVQGVDEEWIKEKTEPMTVYNTDKTQVEKLMALMEKKMPYKFEVGYRITANDKLIRYNHLMKRDKDLQSSSDGDS